MGPSGCCANASDASRGSWLRACPKREFVFALGVAMDAKLVRESETLYLFMFRIEA